MKVTEAIAKLQEILAEHGNIEVVHSDTDWGDGIAEFDVAKSPKDSYSDRSDRLQAGWPRVEIKS